MTNRAGTLLLFVLLISVSGCMNKPALSAEVPPTSTPFQTNAERPTAGPTTLPTVYLPPSPTPISVSALTFTPAPAVMPADFSPVLYGRKYDSNTFFTLLGGVQGGKWLTPEQAASNIGGGLDYDVYTLGKKNFQVYGYAPESSPPGRGYLISTDVNLDETGMVGVVHGWPIKQGDVEELSPDIEIYRQVVLDWLKSEGISTPEIREIHIYRVDLEADGVDEIFLSATHLDGSQHTTKSGDYSILLMRKVLGNEAVTLPILADLYRSEQQEITFPNAYSFANFIDLNQDGVLEVVIDMQHWEADGAAVYQVRGQNIVRVF